MYRIIRGASLKCYLDILYSMNEEEWGKYSLSKNIPLMLFLDLPDELMDKYIPKYMNEVKDPGLPKITISFPTKLSFLSLLHSFRDPQFSISQDNFKILSHTFIMFVLNDEYCRSKVARDLRLPSIPISKITDLLKSYNTNESNMKPFLDSLCNRELHGEMLRRIPSKYMKYLILNMVNPITARALVGYSGKSLLIEFLERDCLSPVVFSELMKEIISSDDLVSFIRIRKIPMYEASLMTGLYGNCLIWVTLWHESTSYPTLYLDASRCYDPVCLEMGWGWGGFFAALSYRQSKGDFPAIESVKLDMKNAHLDDSISGVRIFNLLKIFEKPMY